MKFDDHAAEVPNLYEIIYNGSFLYIIEPCINIVKQNLQRNDFISRSSTTLFHDHSV